MATSKDKRIIEFTELYNPVASIVWIKEVIIPPAQEIKSKISENKTIYPKVFHHLPFTSCLLLLNDSKIPVFSLNKI